MEKDLSNQRSSLSSTSHRECAVLNVLKTTEFGLVIESNCGYEVGKIISVGFHVLDKDGSNSFISAETLVVESQPCVGPRGEFHYLVTLLYSEIESSDRAKLIRLSEAMSDKTKFAPAGLN